MEQFKNLSSWREDILRLESWETKTVKFQDTKPNMFFIVNPNETKLYISIAGIPTEASHEFEIPSNSSMPIGRPTPTGYIYIMNPSTSDITIRLYSIYDTFDLNILKNTSINVDMDGASVKTDGIVKGFSASLPSGSNTLGAVNVNGLSSTDISEMKSIMTENESNSSSIAGKMLSIQNNIIGIADYSRDIRAALTKSLSGANVLTDILGVLGNINVTAGEDKIIYDLISYTEENVTESKTMIFEDVEIEGVVEPATERFCANRMIFFSNDGDKDIEIKLYRNGTDYETLIMKSGESLSDLSMKNPVITISPRTAGDSISYRVLYGIA